MFHYERKNKINKGNEVLIIKKGKERKSANQKFIPKHKILKAKKIKQNEITKNKIELIDNEINDLAYNLALRIDKRDFCQYYTSLLKTKQFSLFYNNDYNSRIVKIDLFLIAFTIEYIVNALFYDDDTMHKIYQSKGEFDFIYQIPITIYSYLISTILNIPLNSLGLSNDAIILFKQEKSKIDIMNKSKVLKK